LSILAAPLIPLPWSTLLTGVALSISAIPATVKVFADLDLLHTRVGETVVSAALFDDVLGLLLLAVLVAVIETGHIPDFVTLTLLLSKVALFFAITVALGAHVYPRISRGIKAMRATAIEFSAPLSRWLWPIACWRRPWRCTGSSVYSWRDSISKNLAWACAPTMKLGLSVPP
jgi:Kef-type K+ transport system membrane component KefB